MINLYYITELDFTSGNSSTNRVLYNALSLQATQKIQVTIIGSSNISQITEKGFIIKNTRKGEKTIIKLFYFIIRGFLIVNLLRKEKPNPDAIIYYGVSSRILIPLFKYSHKWSVKLICDIVEWYDYSHLPMGRFGLSACDVQLAITRLIPKCDGVIAVSSYLKNYYKEKGLETVIVPVTIDTNETEKQIIVDLRFDTKYLNLIYAGIPGKKDLIFTVIETVQELSRIGESVKLHILGPNKSFIKKHLPKLDENVIICHGKIPQDQVAFYLRKADFSIILRPQKRYAKAGFPTKFVESLKVGLPVVANLTSDLSLYLKDGVNGFVVKDCSSEALKNTLQRIIKIKGSQFIELRNNAKATARKCFDYRIFAKDFEGFLMKIMES